ncbi:pro-neuregulin-1, membrane-bound isoform [Arapaima gigas]
MADPQKRGSRTKKPAQVEPRLKNMKSVEVQEGKKAVLKCEPVAGHSITRIKWYKNGKEFPSKKKPKNVKKSSEVRFRKAKVSDSGLYTCEAINDLGKASTSANLTVIRGTSRTDKSRGRRGGTSARHRRHFSHPSCE